MSSAAFLRKIHNASLNTSHSARNLGFISDEHLTFSHLSPKPAGLTSIRQLPAPLLPPSFIPNSITVILSTIDSLSLSPSPADSEHSWSYCTVRYINLALPSDFSARKYRIIRQLGITVYVIPSMIMCDI